MRNSEEGPAVDLLSRRAQARAARRAQVRRRRLAALGGAVAVALVLYLALSGGGSPSSSRGGRASSSPRSATRPGIRAPKPPASLAGADAAATAAVLSYTPYVASGAGHAREVALTFDDGPSSFTPKVLRVLKREHAVATFFEIGREIRAHPALTRAVLAAGMPVGDHTQTHAFLGRLSAAAQAAEIDGVPNALKSLGLPATTLFRPPYGSFNSATLSALSSRKMLMVLWSADTKDFSQPGVQKIVYVAVSGGKPGEIVLMHDGGGPRSQTVAALPRIIRRLRQRGFTLVTIPQLLRDDPPLHGQQPPRSLSGN